MSHTGFQMEGALVAAGLHNNLDGGAQCNLRVPYRGQFPAQHRAGIYVSAPFDGALCSMNRGWKTLAAEPSPIHDQ